MASVPVCALRCYWLPGQVLRYGTESLRKLIMGGSYCGTRKKPPIKPSSERRKELPPPWMQPNKVIARPSDGRREKPGLKHHREFHHIKRPHHYSSGGEQHENLTTHYARVGASEDTGPPCP